MARAAKKSPMPQARGQSSGRQGIIAVKRALDLLEILAGVDTGSGMSLSELARRLQINKQIAFRLVGTLTDAGFTYKNPQSELISLTYKITNIGFRKLIQEKMLNQASSVIRELARETGELVRLAVVERDALVWVLTELGQQRTLNINANYTPGITLNTTATGKAWLSTMTRAQVDRIFEKAPPVQRTSHAVTDRAKIHNELDKVRRTGWAISFDESELGIAAIAAPINVTTYGGVSRCVGTISVAAPTQRMNRKALAALGPRVLDAASRMAQIWPHFSSDADSSLSLPEFHSQ
jgi:DNA-binding IclR family transcriptional regulator